MSFVKMYLISMYILLLCAATGTTLLEINLPLGKLQGHKLKTYNNKEFVAFEGIPYAKPPIGNLRFKEPVAVEPWTRTIVANKLYTCIQYCHYTLPGEDFVKGEEDCLYLNIYVPKLNDTASLEVIVFIHGGGFTFGSGGFYGPSLLLDQNVIYVSFNYRLGPLGFLSTEDETVPGNNGLKDQSLALKWLQKYIKYFGGNPDSITLTGMSAGGASVQLHALSPLSKGLFHRGISQSGCALNPWVFAEKSLEKSKILANHLGCLSSSTIDMIDCLKEKTAYDIVKSVKLFMPFLYNPITPFGVVVDKWAKEPFLNQHPYTLLKMGKIMDIPWIFSHVESEGLYPGSEFISDPQYLRDINGRWNELIPHILDFNNTVQEKNKLKVLKRVRDFYFEKREVTEETYSHLIEMISDRFFLNDIDRALKLHAAAVKSQIYYYYFTYRGKHSKSEFLSRSNKNFGASHGDDTVYILPSNVNTTTTQSDKDMSTVMVNLWTSFASKSVPEINNVNWLPVEKQILHKHVRALIIESPYSQKMKEIIFGNSDFWDSLSLKENHNLYEPKSEL